MVQCQIFSVLSPKNFFAKSVRPRASDQNVRVGFALDSNKYNYKLEKMIGDGGYGQVYEADAISEGKMRTQNDLRSSWSDVQDQQTSRPECSKQQRRNQVY
uniref:Uncharacterized protein n=1 Tax=Meloidogyne enterolobii TaxID=390850 RepID=A0A6V7W4N2_MELEN|nr:unnamed protein product [Meloidogyne enterolobii]